MMIECQKTTKPCKGEKKGQYTEDERSKDGKPIPSSFDIELEKSIIQIREKKSAQKKCFFMNCKQKIILENKNPKKSELPG